MRIKVVVYRENIYWVGQCIEFDISVKAPSLDSLEKRLCTALTAEKECLLSLGRVGPLVDHLPAAPERFLRYWASGRCLQSRHSTPSYIFDMRLAE